MFRTIRWKLTASSLLAIVVPLLAFAYVMGTVLWQFYLEQLQQELRTKAMVVADDAAPILSPRTPPDDPGLRVIVSRWRHYSRMRVTIADAAGIVREATVAEEVNTPVNEQRRPGMRLALSGAENATIWKSPNFGYEDTMYVNVPVRYEGEIVGAVRVAYTLTQIQQNVAAIRNTLLAGVTLYALLIVALTVWLSGTITRPVVELRESAERLAAGDLDHRVRIKGTEEVLQLGNTLNQMAQRLQQLEGMRRLYVSNVSHELRTPLAAIRGMAETLQVHGESDPELQARYLPRMIAQTDRLARLATQLLDLAQIESGNLIHSFEPVTLRSVADEVVHLAGAAASEEGVKLVVEVPSGLPQVQGDHDRLVQVFLNLVDNALRYTPRGGSITLAARQEGECLVATLSDTGSGIPPDHLPHIFERFYRVEKARTRRAGGTGLGLSIVEQIVKAHGGAISVESAVDRGTRFIVRLPVAGAEDDPCAAGAEALA